MLTSGLAYQNASSLQHSWGKDGVNRLFWKDNLSLKHLHNTCLCCCRYVMSFQNSSVFHPVFFFVSSRLKASQVLLTVKYLCPFKVSSLDSTFARTCNLFGILGFTSCFCYHFPKNTKNPKPCFFVFLTEQLWFYVTKDAKTQAPLKRMTDAVCYDKLFVY